jgi:hypothetical protein
MDFTLLNVTIGAVAPSLGTVGGLMYSGWNRRKRQQQFAKALLQAEARRKHILEKGGELRIPTDTWLRERGNGQISWLFVGGYGTSQAPYILSACENAGVQGYCGSIFILDFDHDKLEKCLEAIPPVFHPRITIATCENLWSGVNGGTVHKARSLKPLWWHDVRDGTAAWLSHMQHDTKPVMLQSIVSAAGMAALAEPVIQQFHARYPHLPLYQTTVLDHKTVVRHRYPDVRAVFSQHNLERGHVVIDNLRAFRRNDFGLALLPAAMLAAPAISQQPLEMWNALAYLFPEEHPGGYATVSV